MVCVTPLKTEWFIYGEAGVPVWVLAVCLAAALVVVHRWRRAESVRPGIAGRLLPVTASLLLLATAWIIWRPTLVRVDHWQMEAEMLAYIDASDSMLAPLATRVISDELDLLALLGGGAPPGRNRSAGDLADALQLLAREGAPVRLGMEHAVRLLEQRVPLADTVKTDADGYRSWRTRAGAEVPAAVDAARDLGRAVYGRPPGSLVSALDTAVAAIDALPPAPEPNAQASLGIATARMGDALASVEAAAAALRTLQQHTDARFAEAQGADLDGQLGELRSRTRYDTGGELAPANALPLGTDPAQTDLHGDLRRELLSRHDAVVSHVVLFSDGGHHGAPSASLPRELHNRGIKLITVGVGTDTGRPDFAVLDWELAGPLRAGKPALLTATLKTPPGKQLPCRLAMLAGTQLLAEADITTDGTAVRTVSLEFTAPPEGQHVLALRILTEDDNPANNDVTFGVSSMAAAPRALLIGDRPSWDTAYILLAMRNAGINARQFYHAGNTEPPRRGGSPRAIPETQSQWARNRLVILQGSQFQGFGPDDVDTLLSYVTETGGSLLILSGDADSYLGDFSAKLGWARGERAPGGRPALPATSKHLPVLRLATDGPQSARRVAAFAPPLRAVVVPEQHLALLSDDRGAPLLSLGFYGRGRVYVCGLSGMYRLAEYARARDLDRLLRQLAADAVTPLFATPEAMAAVYPSPPVAGHDNLLISVTPDGVAAGAGGEEIDLQAGIANHWARFRPAEAGPLTVQIGEHVLQSVAVDNPGMERVYYEFDPAFLREFAAAAGGAYVPMQAAPGALAQLQPRTWAKATSEQYPLAGHWGLLTGVAAIGALHWVLRKLAGLVI